jgi:hypothetical protein
LGFCVDVPEGKAGGAGGTYWTDFWLGPNKICQFSPKKALKLYKIEENHHICALEAAQRII